MTQPWSLILHIAYLGIFFLIAMVIRRSIPNFSRFRIPDAIIAGLLALAAKPGLAYLAANTKLGLPALETPTLTAMVYHLLAIGFISLSLKRDTRKGRGRTAVSAGFYNVVSYCIQGTVGFGVGFLLMLTLYPDLFPAFGFLLPFGFAQGPMAGTMASEWATVTSPSGTLAFPSVTAAASVGFSFSTIGFLWACFAGVPLMNILVRRRERLGKPAPGLQAKPPAVPFKKKEPLERKTLATLVDRATTQILLIGLVYVILFLFLKGLTFLLSALLAGMPGILNTLLQIFWSIQFVLGAIIATLLAKFIHNLEDRNIIKVPVTDNRLLQNIGGTSIDFMIAASIAAIDVTVLGAYIVPILIVTTAGGVSTIIYTWFMVRKVWPRTYVEHFVAFFGDHTGTVATGLALLRGVDPEFRTSAASDLVYGSAIAVPMLLPLIFLVTLPVEGFRQGKPHLYWLTIIGALVYLGIILTVWLIPPVFRFLTRYSIEENSKIKKS